MRSYKPQHMRAAQPYWHGATRRLIACGTAAMVAGALAAPTGALAAEWVDVDGDYHETAYGTEADPWMWDGKNDLTLNNYTGGVISAAGKLDVTYKGDNTITGELDEDGDADEAGIYVKDGKKEDAELTVKGNEGDSLSIKDVEEGIDSDGDVTIKGSGKVTIDTTKGWDAPIGILSDGTGSVTLTDGANVTINSGCSGIESNGLTVDGSTLNIKADGLSNDYAEGIYSYNGNVTIKNGSKVNVEVDGTPADSSATGIVVVNTTMSEGTEAAVTVKDSTLNVKVTGIKSSGSTFDAGNAGIAVVGYNASSTITIDNSKVRVSTNGTAMLAETINIPQKPGDADAKASIVLKNAKIVSPSGTMVYTDELTRDKFVVSFATLVNGDSDNWEDNVVSDVEIEGDKKSKDSDESSDADVEQASYTGSASSALAATGDSSASGLAAALGAGVVALGAGLGLRRREDR